jgi:hypothetical protein
MTGGLLISLYLFTLAGFLGLDVIRKVPPTLYGALATVHRRRGGRCRGRSRRGLDGGGRIPRPS